MDKENTVKCTSLEMYCDLVYDLCNSTKGPPLKIKEGKEGVYVEGLSQKVVHDAREAYEVLQTAMKRRHVAITSLNNESSRSHAVFTITVEGKEKKNRLVFVDLAGNEKTYGSTGQILKEANFINTSLAALENTIRCLSQGKHFIPYRDSKLTFLLKNVLGGRSKTIFIACVAPDVKFIQETRVTLEFAQRAKGIKNRAVQKKNVESADVIRQLRKQLAQEKDEKEKLKEEIEKVRKELAQAKEGYNEQSPQMSSEACSLLAASPQAHSSQAQENEGLACCLKIAKNCGKIRCCRWHLAGTRKICNCCYAYFVHRSQLGSRRYRAFCNTKERRKRTFSEFVNESFPDSGT